MIENGFYYDFAKDEPFTPEDFPKIEAKMRELIARDAPFTKEIWKRDDIRALFAEKGETYKVELVDAIPPGEDLKVYRQGDWFDLCRGPHMTSTGKVGTAFKLMKVAGAYWRGDSNNPMLTRIYGTAWATKEDLDAYLHRLEEAERRDHRRLGREMDLFHFQEEGPGVVFWHAKGWTMFQELIAYMRRRLRGDYQEVNAPQILDKSLWETSGHWDWYRENMFAAQSAGDEAEDKRWFAFKPMNCPGPRDDLQARPEVLPRSAAAHGRIRRGPPLRAVGGHARPDAGARLHPGRRAHLLHRGPAGGRVPEDQRPDPLSTYADFGFGEIVVKLSTRPEKRVGSDALWDHAEEVMTRVLAQIEEQSAGRIRTAINPGEGAFYGPKFEYVLRDAIGRDWQCGTTQVDFNLPERFGAFYVDAESGKKPPVMVHRAICGSLERFTGILIEHFAGHFPLWLAPVQVVVATITGDADPYAREVVAAATRLGLRVESDLRNEKINYKVREHSLAKVPVMLVVGRKEGEERTVSVRRLGSQHTRTGGLDETLAALVAEATAPDRIRAEAVAEAVPSEDVALDAKHGEAPTP